MKKILLLGLLFVTTSKPGKPVFELVTFEQFKIAQARINRIAVLKEEREELKKSREEYKNNLKRVNCFPGYTPKFDYLNKLCIVAAQVSDVTKEIDRLSKK